MKSELRACPFCKTPGAKIFIVKINNETFSIQCPECQLSTQTFEDRGLLIDYWNSRGWGTNPGLLNLREALGYLIAGHKIRHCEWPEESLIHFNKDGTLVDQYGDLPESIDLGIEDVWELYQDRKT